MQVQAVKSKPKALRHIKVDPVLKIDETAYKQAKSMCAIHVLFNCQTKEGNKKSFIVELRFYDFIGH